MSSRSSTNSRPALRTARRSTASSTIKQSDPVSVARTLDALFNPPRIIQMPQGNQQNVPLPPLPPPVISVVAEVRTKTVIVRAKPIDFDLIEPLIKELDKVAALSPTCGPSS